MSSVSRLLAFAGGLAALALLVAAFAAANTVPATTVGQIQVPIGANDLKPPECAGITLTTQDLLDYRNDHLTPIEKRARNKS